MSAREDLRKVICAVAVDDAGAKRKLDAYRAEVLREAACLVAEYTGNPIDANAEMLRRIADGTPRPADPTMRERGESDD